ncbi:hypothetical protein [Psychromonas hadalis]|uniref:hypothetical protein n=1 Tax=Psychromonas hadalis TaxID=211669 RepID=UPI0003B56BAF|nr:hypothetical protein [Psychromonas hadalis]
MKKNDLIVASTTRASTVNELDYLHHLLKKAVRPRKRYLKAILNVLVLWGFSLLGLLLASGLFSYLAHYSTMLSSLLNLPMLKEVLIFTTGCYALFSTKKWLAEWENPYPLILQDIQCAQVEDESYFVHDLCRFQVPELGGFIYFLKISEQAVFVIYDYQSQDDVNHAFLVQKKLTLSKAPCCDHYLEYVFTGDGVALSATYPLTVVPEEWPLPDRWLALPWSQLRPTFSPK